MNTVNPRGLLLPDVSQYEVDFVIPRIGIDVPVGIDPFLYSKVATLNIENIIKS